MKPTNTEPRWLVPFALLVLLAAAHEGTPRAAGKSERAALDASSALFQELVRTVGPAVVGVTAVSAPRGARGGARVSRGSGVVLAEDGLIVTNRHVIAGAEDVRVTLADGRERRAEVRGVDAETDLAVLRIDARGLETARLSEDAPPEPGGWVLALGNPYGLARSVSFGIVSGNGRVLDLTTYEDYIQTDAAINSGNSGGALVDLDGSVVGINTAKGTRFDGSLGLGFAIPAYLVREVVPELDRSGHVRRGWLGVQFRPLNLDGARDLGLALPGYVAIDRVIPGGPAESAGLAIDDVILRVNGRAVTDGQGLLMAVARLEPGTSAELEILRDGARSEVSVQVGERELGER